MTAVSRPGPCSKRHLSTHDRTLLGDLSEREGYDFEQIKSIAKVQVR